MKPIETIYKGYKFRSRLEARYAVFFDALRIDWSYEPEGFKLKSGRYLPDFRLLDIPCWAEVKGEKPTDIECMFAKELCALMKEDVWLFYGDVMHYQGDGVRLCHHWYTWYPVDDEMLSMFWRDPDEYGGIERVELLAKEQGEVFTMDDVLPGHIAHHLHRNILQVLQAATQMRAARFEFRDAEPTSLI